MDRTNSPLREYKYMRTVTSAALPRANAIQVSGLKGLGKFPVTVRGSAAT